MAALALAPVASASAGDKGGAERSDRSQSRWSNEKDDGAQKRSNDDSDRSSDGNGDEDSEESHARSSDETASSDGESSGGGGGSGNESGSGDDVSIGQRAGEVADESAKAVESTESTTRTVGGQVAERASPVGRGVADRTDGAVRAEAERRADRVSATAQTAVREADRKVGHTTVHLLDVVEGASTQLGRTTADILATVGKRDKDSDAGASGGASSSAGISGAAATSPRPRGLDTGSGRSRSRDERAAAAPVGTDFGRSSTGQLGLPDTPAGAPESALAAAPVARADGTDLVTVPVQMSDVTRSFETAVGQGPYITATASVASGALPSPGQATGGRSAPEALAGPGGGSGAGAALLFIALLSTSAFLTPPGVSGRLSPYSASAMPVLYLSALERPG